MANVSGNHFPSNFCSCLQCCLSCYFLVKCSTYFHLGRDRSNWKYKVVGQRCRKPLFIKLLFMFAMLIVLLLPGWRSYICLSLARSRKLEVHVWWPTLPGNTCHQTLVHVCNVDCLATSLLHIFVCLVSHDFRIIFLRCLVYVSPIARMN